MQLLDETIYLVLEDTPSTEIDAVIVVAVNWN